MGRKALGNQLLLPDIITSIRRLERIKIKICRQKVFILFSKYVSTKKCNANTYIHTRIHTHTYRQKHRYTHTHIYIVCVCEREREREGVYVCVCMRERERERVCVCMYMYERERERDGGRGWKAPSITVMAVGNGICNPSSNLGRSYLRFTLPKLCPWKRHESNSTPAIG